jgi:hypothetical protein
METRKISRKTFGSLDINHPGKIEASATKYDIYTD